FCHPGNPSWTGGAGPGPGRKRGHHRDRHRCPGWCSPGVTITVRNVESGVTRTIVTEADGRYRLGGIPPGRYNLIAELQGFATVDVKEVTLTLGLEYPRDFTMGVQGVQESITVTGEAPVIETTKTEVAAVVTQDQIETLPTGDRVA